MGTSFRFMFLLSNLSSSMLSLISCSSLLVIRKCTTFVSSYEYGSFSRARWSTSTPFTYPLNCLPSAYGTKSLGTLISSCTTWTRST